MKQLLIFLLCVMSVLPAFGGASATPEQAAALYRQRDYRGAMEMYKAVMAEKGTNAALLYDLGNTYVKLGDAGNAMVCYQEALALDPVNQDIRNNIQYLSGKVEDGNRSLLEGRKLDVSAGDVSFIQSVQRRISEAAAADTYGAIALGAFILMLVGMGLYILGSGIRLRKTGFFGAIVCLGLTVLFNLFAFAARERWNARNQAVITAYEAQIYPEPSASSSPKVPKLKGGTVLEVQTADNKPAEGWVNVRLNSDYNGWMQTADLHLL